MPKRTVDVLLAASLLLAVLPALLLLVALVAATSRGGALHRQVRVGRGGAPFVLLKLRTMRPAPAEGLVVDGGLAPGGVEGVDRRTPIGRWLRRTSLDELPQLINVLRGEMSLVGPRPERPARVELFCSEVPGYAGRLAVRPGLTGVAQVRGLRGATSIADRVAADLEYVERAGMRTDAVVLLRTPRAMLAGDRAIMGACRGRASMT